jgi:predicted acylesterase/phospholipase RssA
VQTLDRLLRARKLGVLFAGGASRAAFQVGVIEALLQAGVRPSVCLGVSAGSWNAAAVAVGNWKRLRAYWRFFCRMPAVDMSNLLREHSPFAWSRIHERGFRRYIGLERLRAPEALPLFVALTRLRDRASVIVDLRRAEDPFRVLLASNYLPPFYTHPPEVDGEACGDGGFSDSLPYERLFEEGCDLVVILSQKGECEGGLYRNPGEPDHEIPTELRDRVIVIRPAHRLDVSFVERNWRLLSKLADDGAARATDILFDRTGDDPGVCDHGKSATWYLTRVWPWRKTAAVPR